METKRTIIAVVLSIIVLFGWQILADRMGWNPPREQITQPEADTFAEDIQEDRQIQPEPKNETIPSALPVFTPNPGREVSVDTPLYTAVFYSSGGFLKSFVLKGYRQGIEPDSPLQNLADETSFAFAPMGLSVNGQASWAAGEWSFEGTDIKLEGNQKASLTFTGMVDGIRISREFVFDASTFLILETVHLSGADRARTVRLGFKAGSSSLSSASNYDLSRVSWLNNNSIEEDSNAEKLKNEGLQEQGSFLWGGVMNNYFMATVAPQNYGNITLKARIQDGFWGVLMEQSGIVLEPGAQSIVKANWWYGAKERTLLDNAPSKLSETVDLGMFGFISRPLLFLLVFFQSYVNNWGIAIILLTLLIRIIFFPLSQKSYRSMEKMKKLQPQIQKLKEKYADNREALNREVMQLYRTYGANPASGCLPILVQLPVFFGLYKALLNSLELRHAAFISQLPFTDMLWLADLSARDPLYISPILMGATMFLQQKMSPAAGDAMQQKIMLAMPIIFTVMFLNFPSGLVVYWFFNNIFSIIQQWLIMRGVNKEAPQN